MRTRSGFAIAFTAVLGLVAWSNHRDHPADPSVCAGNDDYMVNFLRYVDDYVSRPGAQEARVAIQVPTLPRGSARRVTTDSLCARAALLMNREQHLANTAAHTVYMAAIGNRYWAEDKSRAGEWIQGLILDSTLSTVLARPGR